MEPTGKQFGGSREGGTMGTLMAGKGRDRGTKGGGERTGKRERENLWMKHNKSDERVLTPIPIP